MLRLLIVAALAYAGYRAGRNFIDGVPSDFEPVSHADERRKARRKRSDR